MAGILWPVVTQKYNVSTSSSLRYKCNDLSFSGHHLGARHTSEIELALFEWIEVRERVVLDKLCGEPHGGEILITVRVGLLDTARQCVAQSDCA